MSWLPRFYVYGAILCDDIGEYEGTTVGIEWRCWAFEFTWARRSRIVGERS